MFFGFSKNNFGSSREKKMETLKYEGCNFLRQRVVFSILSGRPLKISGIRAFEDDPGLKDFEMKFFKIIDQITNGSRLEIDRTGAEFHFSPGLLHGGSIDFDCGLARCISYYLEPLMLLAPFAKRPIQAKYYGITNCSKEPSVDAIRSTWLPVFAKFLPDDQGLEIKIIKRGLLPEGGGSVVFKSPICRQLRPIQREKFGKLCKIRGWAYTCRVNATMANRMIDSAKKALQGFLTDVYITVDQRRGEAAGKSPGYGLILTGETTEGVFYHGEAISRPRTTIISGEESKSRPKDSIEPKLLTAEDVGQMAADNFLNEIYRGGCLDSTAQSLAVVFMTLCPNDVSKFLFGHIGDYCVYTLRHLRDFFGVQFQIDQWKNENELKLGSESKALMTCVGAGYSNLNKMLL